MAIPSNGAYINLTESAYYRTLPKTQFILPTNYKHVTAPVTNGTQTGRHALGEVVEQVVEVCSRDRGGARDRRGIRSSGSGLGGR